MGLTLVSILLFSFIMSCGKKVEYVDRVIYKDKVVELKAELISPPKCYFIESKGFYKVQFSKCNDNYCLDNNNAIKLIINVENLKNCYNQLREWSNTVCQNKNVVCLEDKETNKTKK